MLPPWLNWPTAVTLLRLALLPVFLALLITGDAHRTAATVILLVMAATDVLDGQLARRLGQVSRVGALLDPLADKLLVNLTLMLLTLQTVAPAGFGVPWPLIAGVYLKDLGVLIGVAVVHHRVGRVKLAAGIYGKLSTFAQLLLIGLTLIAPLLQRHSGNLAATLCWLAQWITLLATAAAAVGYSLEGARQLRQAGHLPQMQPFRPEHSSG